MQLAIIDLGTNSVRFDVHQISPSGDCKLLYREKLMVRLGEDVFLRGCLHEEAKQRTLDALRVFNKVIKTLKVNRVVAFATSALRDASDGHRFLAEVKRKTSIEVRIISGDEEARLIAKGILLNSKNFPARFALVDIGGGSTEISICHYKKITHSASFNLGVARLQQIFLKTIPPRRDAKGKHDPIKDLQSHIHETLTAVLSLKDWPHVTQVIGSSGTVRAISKLIRTKKGSKKTDFSKVDLGQLMQKMRTMTPTQLLLLPGMEAKRLDMILAGSILLSCVMKELNAKKVVPTELSLRDGVLAEEIDLYRKHQKSKLPFHMKDIVHKARQLGADRNHFENVLATSDTLFKGLSKKLEISPLFKNYLLASAVLHDSGYSISPTDHEKHGYYIARNANIPGLEAWEHEFIASLCLYHKGNKPKPADVAFSSERKKYKAFMGLLGILRVADALDHSHRGILTLNKIRLSRKTLELFISQKGPAHMELLKFEQKKALLEKIIKKKIVLKLRLNL